MRIGVWAKKDLEVNCLICELGFHRNCKCGCNLGGKDGFWELILGGFWKGLIMVGKLRGIWKGTP